MRSGYCNCEVGKEDERSCLFIFTLELLSRLDQMNEAARQFSTPMPVIISTSKIERDAIATRVEDAEQ